MNPELLRLRDRFVHAQEIMGDPTQPKGWAGVPSHYAPSHVDYCPLRHLKAGELTVQQPAAYHKAGFKIRIAVCRCPYKPGKLATYAAILDDQRSRGIDPWSDEGFNERMATKRPKRQAPSTNGHGPMDLASAVRDLTRARRKVEEAEAEVRRLFAEGVKRGERLAVLGRIIGVSRQRAHQMARELDA